jgi:hypothetical protein
LHRSLRDFQCLGIVFKRAQRVGDLLEGCEYGLAVNGRRRLIGVYCGIALGQYCAAMKDRLRETRADAPDLALRCEQTRRRCIGNAERAAKRDTREQGRRRDADPGAGGMKRCLRLKDIWTLTNERRGKLHRQRTRQ